ncbi:MAG: DUF5610 domain-containing protein [Magnetococcales bacterium]|nr:DUF5610 domain-containing protein [Magnetococcales bacterium]
MSFTAITQFQSATYTRFQTNQTQRKSDDGGTSRRVEPEMGVKEPSAFDALFGDTTQVGSSSTTTAAYFNLEIGVIRENVEFSSIGSIEQANELLMQKVRETLDKMVEQVPELEGLVGLDPAQHTPEKTAEFIVRSATAFYGMYAEAHSDDEDMETLDGFMALIRGAIDEGFGEARDMLDALSVLNGDVEKGVDRTYDLVQQGLDDFYAQQMAMLMEMVKAIGDNQTSEEDELDLATAVVTDSVIDEVSDAVEENTTTVDEAAVA